MVDRKITKIVGGVLSKALSPLSTPNMRTYDETVSGLGLPASRAVLDDWSAGKIVVARWLRRGANVIRSEADALRVVARLGGASRLHYTQADVDISISRSTGDTAIIPAGPASVSIMDGTIDAIEVFVETESLGVFGEDGAIFKPRFDFADDDLRASAIGVFLSASGTSREQPKAASARFGNAVFQFLASSIVKKKVSSRGGLAPCTLRRIDDMIDARLNEPSTSHMSVIKLAEEARLSLNHFIRAFRETTGTTPYQYLMSRRRGHAMDLLRRPGMSLAEVSDRLGFSSRAHFIASFRRRFGATPGDYRNAILDPAILGPRNIQ